MNKDKGSQWLAHVRCEFPSDIVHRPADKEAYTYGLCNDLFNYDPQFIDEGSSGRLLEGWIVLDAESVHSANSQARSIIKQSDNTFDELRLKVRYSAAAMDDDLRKAIEVARPHTWPAIGRIALSDSLTANLDAYLLNAATEQSVQSYGVPALATITDIRSARNFRAHRHLLAGRGRKDRQADIVSLGVYRRFKELNIVRAAELATERISHY